MPADTLGPASRVPPDSPALRRVQAGDLCAGCGGCASIAPDKLRMALVEPGFLRPVQSAPLSPVEEDTIAAICPGLGQRVEDAGRTPSVLWGPYLEMQTGWATDPDLRFAGSSGGALSMLLCHLLETGAVDGVIQTAAAPQLSIGNGTVLSTRSEGVLAAAGSRYAPSAPLEGLHARLTASPAQRFAFVGKPCDVAALRALQEQDPGLAARVPVLLSFFCAGVPSLRGGLEVLAALEAPYQDTVAFRYRGNGWPGYATATLADGTTRQMSYHDSWGRILSRHVQHRCKICADGTGTAADLVCADAWEADEKGYPLFDEQEGVSLIVARTVKGQQILAAAQAAGRLETAPFDPTILAAIQPGQRERRRALLARLAGLRVCGRPVPDYRGLTLKAAAAQNPLGRNLRNFFGMIRRSLRRKPGRPRLFTLPSGSSHD
ncbi:coenzyme F420 hydrogenase/dehydrogenase, beta subunit (plasmid) [Dinoroseobacter shibae DFL 12 = DSM 16493]|jgi:coenzyme F420 hydrogenase subunit beta|uniref:Coenzyme F420 hydrogenase/dehydrogenase, beta subunit n=1 Tax=Dinoroseobacter shibae (strain DSM 16493 / NCIMB 14021 / DFL 12) TaxID=398580 RepID=A8LUC9_DINSH|nr:Coenzyme F420 hydrogenase/dehydrogenase, beta subunit C-terminal domain [Dinoroseobacter shibae]ABV95846.2 coenzyme F420 hydrogenase/dehydrogenase, beta subunit [Dinoroseobacter shibae DFL 12 = DSM 16493]URF49092.1 Coenzyme F420 hydrogenase/dehydrogenase, beta subunit C-terminal domain [Dinoroseobacter shibae]URF53401.1 Coenzyme F420 hydrogenase/dehydrogenase, beta subunit C-terminal domain [Dinoroseobacter shibae]